MNFRLDHDDFRVILENVNSLLRNITIDVFKNNERKYVCILIYITLNLFNKMTAYKLVMN